MVHQWQRSNRCLLNWVYGVCLCALVCWEWEVEEKWMWAFLISLFWNNGPKRVHQPLEMIFRYIMSSRQDFFFLFTFKLFSLFSHWFMITLIERTYSKSMITVLPVEVAMKALSSACLGLCMLVLGCYLRLYAFEKHVFFQIISRVLQNLLTNTALAHAKQK